VARHKANTMAMAALAALPEDTMACGGGAHNLQLKQMLTAARAG
jgi:1,6-anhydro-N-acetylmuramate kinase